jgi:predicted ATPase
MILSEKELHLDSLRTNLNVVDDYQTQIFFKQIEQEGKYDSFVSDRSFDCLAYTAQHSRVFSHLMKSAELEKYVVSLKKSDAIMFFVRPSKATLKEDGIREHLTWDGIVAIDAMVKLLFETFGLRYFQINTDSMQERVRLIDSVISLHNS